MATNKPTLRQIAQSNATTRQIPQWNGTAWTPVSFGFAKILVSASDAPAFTKLGSQYVCDGVNDEVEIQTALNSIISTGGTVECSSGTFNLGAKIVIANKWMGVVGQGINTILKIANGVNDHAISITGTGVVEVKIQRLQIQGNKANNLIAGSGIYVATPWLNGAGDTQHLFEDIYITGCRNDGFEVGVNSDTRVLWLNRIHVTLSGRYGYNLPAPSQTDGIFNNCIADSCGIDGFLVGGLNNHFYGCKSFYNTSRGFTVTGYTNYFVGCEWQDNFKEGFYAIGTGYGAGGYGGVLTACIGDSNGNAYDGLTQYGVRLVNTDRWIINGGQYFNRDYGGFGQLKGIRLEGTTTQVTITNVQGFGYANNATDLIQDVSTGNNTVISANGVTNKMTIGTLTAGGNTYPTVTGSVGQVLTTNGAGLTSWSTVSGGGASWGAITGTLSSQTDLNTALTNKADYKTPTTNTTFLGANAGNTTLTGTDNTAVGSLAGSSLTTGAGNTYFGKSTGRLNATSSFNVAIGPGALQNQTGGQANTAGGNNSLGSLTTGAGLNITTGNNNTFFGNNTGTGWTTGSNNLAFGLGSGSDLESGMSTSNGVACFGSEQAPINVFYYGQGVRTQYSPSPILRPSNRNQNDSQAGNLILASGLGRGNGASSAIEFRTPIVSGTSGSTLQTEATRLTIATSGITATVPINGVSLTTAGSTTTYLNGAGTYTTPAGGGASLSQQVVQVDFGVIEDQVTTVPVSAPWVTATSKIIVMPAYTTTTNHDPDDYAIEGVQAYVIDIVPGVGFNLIANARDTTWGNYNFNIIYN
jgi:hypothetical protein